MTHFLSGLDGRYFVSLWVTLQTMAFALALPRRPRFWLRGAVSSLVLLLLIRELLMLQTYVISVPLVIRTLMALAGAAALCWCCETSFVQALYAAVWVMMTQQTLQNASSACYILLHLEEVEALPYWLYLLPWILITLPLVYRLLGVTLFSGGYAAGRRHLLLVAALYVEFELVQGFSEIKMNVGLGTNYQFVLMNGLCLLVALYLVHTLFTQQAVKNQLAVTAARLENQRERYQQAKQNVFLINRRCHELKLQLARLRKAQTTGEQDRCLERLSEAIEIYDSSLDTGSDVLNIVLGERSLYCRERGIRLHCVADGGQLSFLDPVDLYTLFSLMLQRALDCLEEGRRGGGPRELDVTVYRRQDMVILEVACPLPEGDALPGEPDPSAAFLLQKYSAALHAGEEHGAFSQRCLIPLPTQN